MTAADSLLRAVCERPFDDGPRLVYADWLDEHGERERERAEYIRLQIAGEYAEPRPEWVEPMMKVIGISTTGKHGTYDDFGTEACYRNGDTVMSYFWRRGLVNSVSLSMSALLGGECERCHGLSNWRDALTGSGQCFDCSGSGRTPGLAPALSAWPITQVTITDREPYVGATKASWYDESQRHESTRFRLSSLPTSLYRHLSNGVGNGPYTPYGRWYDCRDAALTALSRACVDLIRSLAEPPLRPIFGNRGTLTLRRQVERVAQ